MAPCFDSGLADSFDVLPSGRCAGRPDNRGMSGGARIQLRGDTSGGSVWSVASAQLAHRSPPMRDDTPLYADDGLYYCVVKAVFVPTDRVQRAAIPSSLSVIGEAPLRWGAHRLARQTGLGTARRASLSGHAGVRPIHQKKFAPSGATVNCDLRPVGPQGRENCSHLDCPLPIQIEQPRQPATHGIQFG